MGAAMTTMTDSVLVQRLMKPILQAFAILVMGFSSSRSAETPQLSAPDEAKLLMLDSRVIEHADNARLTLGTPEKEAGNPLLVSDQPWENATNNYYPNVIWDEDDSLWKMWYKDVLADPEVIAKMDRPSTVHEVGWYLLYAISRDGTSWQKPSLRLHQFGGSTENNITARDCPNVGVFKDLHDPDPKRRFKMVFDVGLGKPRARFSADGLRWGETVEMKGFGAKQGDTHNNAFFDVRLGKYLWFTKLYLGERLVTRLESDDFVNWRSSGVVLRSSLDEGRAHQTYALTVFPYANLWLGWLMMYHLGTDRTVDVELAWSHDSVHWQRVAPGSAFLPLGERGTIDSGCIYAQAGPSVVQEGRHLIYYGGSPTVHLGWKRSGHLCLARLREDGFAFMEPVDQTRGSVLTTRLLRAVPGRELRIVADGMVTMERLAAVEGDHFRLKLALHPGAKLYAIEGVSLVSTSLPPPPDPEPLQRHPSREPLVFSFENDVQGWKGVDELAHHPEGFVTVSRTNGLRPIAHATPLPGDWSERLGGDEVSISARVRSGKPGGSVRLELFARDVAQWSYEALPPFTKDWQTIRAVIRYDWTDAQARSAGWVPSPQAYSWRETIRHAGKVVVVASDAGAQTSFDLDDVRLEPR